MTAKLREKHKLKVPERNVLQALHEIDPQGVERRGDVGLGKKKKRKETFVSLVSQLKSMMICMNGGELQDQSIQGWCTYQP